MADHAMTQRVDDLYDAVRCVVSKRIRDRINETISIAGYLHIANVDDQVADKLIETAMNSLISKLSDIACSNDWLDRVVKPEK